ncbi:MAG: TraB/GumN family protein [Bacteroidetes bacterium]|nr:MAG: TraB/GumN family protein [Bacteroidota bacterium]
MRRFITISVLLFLATQLTGQNFEKGLLWKVSGKNLQQSSFVFGTLHVICPDEFVIFPGTEKSLDASERIVLELDISNPEVLMGMQMGMIMRDEKKLTGLLSEEDFAKVSNFFKDSLGMNISMVERVQPFFLVSIIMPHMIECLPQSYEEFFVQQARQRELELAGLETLQEQLDVFDALSYEQQAEMLLEVLRDYEVKREEFRHMLDTYLSQDIKALEKLFKELETEFDEFNRRLIEERNHRWIERMENLMQEKSTFFAVGAGHLPGEHGVLKLLVDRGYTIDRIVE